MKKKRSPQDTSYLALVRHGESEWNALGLWTGWTDIALTHVGRDEAKQAAEAIRDISFHVAHTSLLSRAQETLTIMLETLKLSVPIHRHHALNERNYGILTGKNKWKIKKKYGEKQFMLWRRSWNHPVPEGETLQDVYQRVLPYFKTRILPDLRSGKNILIAAHGNSLRALVKHLEKISDKEISHFEIGTGELLLYHVSIATGEVIHKEIRTSNPKRGKQ